MKWISGVFSNDIWYVTEIKRCLEVRPQSFAVKSRKTSACWCYSGSDLWWYMSLVPVGVPRFLSVLVGFLLDSHDFMLWFRCFMIYNLPCSSEWSLFIGCENFVSSTFWLVSLPVLFCRVRSVVSSVKLTSCSCHTCSLFVWIHLSFFCSSSNPSLSWEYHCVNLALSVSLW